MRVVFNGPGAVAWRAAGRMQADGQPPISLTRISRLDADVDASDRLPELREPPV